jgi:hypothetical protein
MKKKISTSAQKDEESRATPREEFRNILTSQIKRIYRSKAKAINFKDSDKTFLLVALKRALSHDWYKEDIRGLEKREGDARTAIYEAKDIHKGLEDAAKIMGWIKGGGENSRLKKTKLTPAEEKDLIRTFKSLQMFRRIPKEGEDEFEGEEVLTKKEAIEFLCEKYQWHSEDSFDKYIRRLLNKYEKNHENIPPHEDQMLEDMLMDISELEKRLDT